VSTLHGMFAASDEQDVQAILREAINPGQLDRAREHRSTGVRGWRVSGFPDALLGRLGSITGQAVRMRKQPDLGPRMERPAVWGPGSG